MWKVLKFKAANSGGEKDKSIGVLAQNVSNRHRLSEHNIFSHWKLSYDMLVGDEEGLMNEVNLEPQIWAKSSWTADLFLMCSFITNQTKNTPK